MFDIGFSEILLIAVVALVVLGPERLPRVARTAGHLLGRFQRYANQVKSDISREMQLEEIKKMQAQMQEAAQNLEQSIKAETRDIEAGVSATAAQIDEAVVTPVKETAIDVAPLDAGEIQRFAEAAEAETRAAEAEISRHLAPAEPALAAGEPQANDAVPDAQLALTFDTPAPTPAPSANAAAGAPKV